MITNTSNTIPQNTQSQSASPSNFAVPGEQTKLFAESPLEKAFLNTPESLAQEKAELQRFNSHDTKGSLRDPLSSIDGQDSLSILLETGDVSIPSFTRTASDAEIEENVLELMNQAFPMSSYTEQELAILKG